MTIARGNMAKQTEKAPAKKKKKKGLWDNINARKKKGISRSKKKSTISKEAYANMKEGFPKANKGMYVNKNIPKYLKNLCIIITSLKIK